MKNVIEPQGIDRTLCAEDLADLELRDESLYIAACSPKAFIISTVFMPPSLPSS